MKKVARMSISAVKGFRLSHPGASAFEPLD
jgi:hypothetical protein